MNDKNIFNKIKSIKSHLLIYGIIILVIIISAGTYASWVWRGGVSSIEFTVNSSDLLINCAADGGTQDEKVSLMPANCLNERYAIQRTINVYPEIYSYEKSLYMDLSLTINEIGSGLKASQNFKYALTTNPSSCTTNLVSSGTFYNKSVGTKINLLNDEPFTYTGNPLNTRYYLYIWIDPNEENPNILNQEFDFKLSGECTDGPRVDIEPIAGAAMLINKANDASITTYSSGDTGEMYTFSQPATDKTAPLTDYRYIGNAPDNYITFNNETWRIIGIFDNKIKIIKNEATSDSYYDNKGTGVGTSTSSSGSTDWTDAQIMYTLNQHDLKQQAEAKKYIFDGTYVRDTNGNIVYQKGCLPAAISSGATEYTCSSIAWNLNDTAYSQIIDANYYFVPNTSGITSTALDNINKFYGKERNEGNIWYGKVGLPYPSDYGYTFAYGVDNTCYNNYSTCTTSDTSWFSTFPTFTSTNEVIKLFYTRLAVIHHNATLQKQFGLINYYLATAALNGYYPTVYLKPDIELTGTGTSSDPYQIVETPKTLYDTILLAESNAETVTEAKRYINNKQQPTFSITATTDEGLFIAQDDNGPAYYYRGAVDDNHVVFGGFCWEIIRTTGTGGVKMIYDGTPTNNQCNNTGAASILTNLSEFNIHENSPAFVGYMYGTVYNVQTTNPSDSGGTIIFGKDVTYKNGKYTLTNETFTTEFTKEQWDIDHETILGDYHYTCLSNEKTCETIKYIYYGDSDISIPFLTNSYAKYIEISNGKKIEDALNEMFSNITNSQIKTNIESWYNQNMTEYTTMLEDTPFCNDRSINDEYYGGWKINSSATSSLYFAPFKRTIPSLICQQKKDKFTVNTTNGNGKSIYPVGLITTDEISLASNLPGKVNYSSYLHNEDYLYWTMSPSRVDVMISHVNATYSQNGTSYLNGVTSEYGVRPVISLKSGTVISKGTGIPTDPYIVE